MIYRKHWKMYSMPIKVGVMVALVPLKRGHVQEKFGRAIEYEITTHSDIWFHWFDKQLLIRSIGKNNRS